MQFKEKELFTMYKDFMGSDVRGSDVVLLPTAPIPTLESQRKNKLNDIKASHLSDACLVC